MPFPVALHASFRPRVIVLALVALSAAGCSSDTSRFDSPFSNPFASQPQVAANAPASSAPQSGRIESTALPAPAQTASYQPANTGQRDVTGSAHNRIAAAPSSTPAPRSAASQSQAAHTVAPGETMLGIAKRYNVAVKDLAQANSIEPHTQVKMGDRLVIPGRLASAKPPVVAAKPAAKPAAAPAQPQPKLAAAAPTKVASLDPTQTARAVNPTPDADAEVKASGSGSPSFRWPVRGRIIAGFGPKPNGQQNDGINLSVPEGTPIKAAEDGVVAYAGNELKGFGNLVLVRHPNGFVTAYAHASELLVKRGDNIKRGQTIAKAGQTGTVTSPQVHFEIRKGSLPVDPTQYLNGA